MNEATICRKGLDAVMLPHHYVEDWLQGMHECVC